MKKINISSQRQFSLEEKLAIFSKSAEALKLSLKKRTLKLTDLTELLLVKEDSTIFYSLLTFIYSIIPGK